MVAKRVKVLVPQKFPIAGRNSDVIYLKNMKLDGYEFEPYTAKISTWETNAKYAAAPIARRLKVPSLAAKFDRSRWTKRVHLPQSEFMGCVGAISNMYLPEILPPVPIIYEHDFLVSAAGSMAGQRGVFLEALDRRTISKMAAIVVRSEASASSARQMLMNYPADRIRVIPHYMPHIALGKPREVSEFTEQKELRILFVGRQANQKGLPCLIEAVERLRAAGRQMSLTVISNFADGPVENVHDQGRVFSVLSRVEVQELMQQAHIVALPSHGEAFGMVLAEAAAVGCALIFPDYEPQVSMFRGAGMPVEPGNTEALVEALRILDADRVGTHEYGSRAQEIWQRDFNPDLILERYQALFKEVYG